MELNNKLDYITKLETIYPDIDLIIDQEDNIILPNMKGLLPSTSIFLREDIFSKYLDTIIFNAFQQYGNQICLFKSVFYTDYFITIDFIDFLYKIPNILLNTINNCTMVQDIRFYVIPLRLNLTYKDAHSNVIIVDNYYKTIEFFEPHGTTFMGSYIPKPYNIENHIKILLSRLFPIYSQYYTYINVQNNCPIGLQTQQNIINPQSGHCLAWSLLFIHIRINNLYLSTDYIIKYFNRHFTPKDLDIYIKRYIGLLETSTFYINTKTLPNFKYNLNLSRQEKTNIFERIVTLTQQYLIELNSTNDKTILNTIFEELISYHKFPNFNEIFFNTVNTFINNTYNQSNTVSQQIDTTDDSLTSKRKLFDTNDTTYKKFKSNDTISLTNIEKNNENFSNVSYDDDEDELSSLYE